MAKYRVVQSMARHCIVEANASDEAVDKAYVLEPDKWTYISTLVETTRARRLRREA